MSVGVESTAWGRFHKIDTPGPGEDRLLNRFLLAHRFVGLVRGGPPGACGKASEVLEIPTDGFGGPPGGPRSPWGPGNKT